MKERNYYCPISVHVTAADLAAIDAAAAASGSKSRNAFVKSAIQREIDRLKPATGATVEVAE